MTAKLTPAKSVETVASQTTHTMTRKYHRSLAMCVREAIDPMRLVEWNLMILQGKCPALVTDGRTSDGYRVTEGSGPAPTMDDQRKAMEWLSQRGYGLPVQQVLLDAELRGQFEQAQANLDIQQVGALDRAARSVIIAALRGAARTELDATRQPVLDVASETVPETSSEPSDQ